jgi:hypothetical protein
MRRLAILTIVLGCAAPAAALAAPATAPSATADRLAQAAFLPNAGRVETDPIGSLLDRETYAPGAGLVGWRSDETPLFDSHSALRIREGSLIAAPGELPLSQRAQVDPRSYEVTVIHNWPGALSFDAGRISVDVSPHAGFGVIGGDRDDGASAEAGATVQLSKADLAAARLKALGVRDGAAFGDQGRWYLFAAASGRAVGLNMLRSDSGWNRAGWSTDPTSHLMSNTQVGVGWRKGPVQTSIGYVRRDVKGAHLMQGVDPHSDSMVAFSLSIRRR